MNHNPVFPELTPFKYWSNLVLPTVYDDSLSYYEVLNKVTHKLNEVVVAAAQLADSLVSTYSSETAYSVGDYCWNNGKLYKCLTANNGTWNNADWKEVVFTDEIAGDFENFKSYVRGRLEIVDNLIVNVIGNIAEPYDAETEYAVGDYVTHNAILYKCTNATTGTFNPSDWTPVVIIDELNTYVNALWDNFLNNYITTLGVVQTTGTSITDVMSQNATTLQLLARLENKGILDSGSISAIEDENSIYALINTRSYDDYPFPTQSAENGIVITLHLKNTHMWIQYFLTWLSASAASMDDAGVMYVRTGIDREYTEWKRVNVLPDELSAAIESVNTVRGILPSGAISDITDRNSVYALLSDRTYSDYPIPAANPKNGFVYTSNPANTSMWVQTFIPWYSADGESPYKYHVYVRTGLSRDYGDWGRIGVTPSELEDELAHRLLEMPYDGSASTPKAIISDRTPQSFSTYFTPSWVTDTINNITASCGMIKFGAGNNAGNAGVLGIERSTLKTFVMADNTNSTSLQYESGAEKTATVKLTSYAKKIIFYGDSIMWGRNGDISGSSTPGYRVNKTMPSTIKRNLGVNADNFAVGGQGYIHDGSNDKTAYEEIQAHTNTDGDYFVLAWGVNDWQHIKNGNDNYYPDVLGTYLDTDQTQGDTFMKEVYKCVNYLYTQKPMSQVILVKPWNGRNVGAFPAYKDGNIAQQKMCEELEKFCTYYGLPYIGKDCPLCGYTMNSIMSTDGVHPSLKGYEFLGNWLSGKLANIIG